MTLPASARFAASAPTRSRSSTDDFDRDRHIGKLWEYYVGRARAAGVLPNSGRFSRRRQAFASWIACQMRNGVAGIVMSRMP